MALFRFGKYLFAVVKEGRAFWGFVGTIALFLFLTYGGDAKLLKVLTTPENLQEVTNGLEWIRKTAFVVAALLFVIATFTVYDKVEQELKKAKGPDAALSRKREIRNKLAKFKELCEKQEVEYRQMGETRGNQNLPIYKQTDDLIGEIKTYLEETTELGYSYVVKFESKVGAPHNPESVYFFWETKRAEKYAAIYAAGGRLTQFLDDFKP